MEKLTSIIESILFVSGKEVAIKDIAEKLCVTEKEVVDAYNELKNKYNNESGINILHFNKKLQFCSNPIYKEEVSSVLNPIKGKELSRSMLEVASIIAYKQPVTRLDLEELRGCNSEYAVQNLLKLGVIEVVGRKDTIGKPALFGTTDEFLKRFQISSLDELPNYEELMAEFDKLKSPSNSSDYLFAKDEYVEETEAVSTMEEDSTENVEGFELGEISEEEIPDFLEGEDINVIE